MIGESTVVEARVLKGQCWHGLLPEDAVDELVDRLRMGEWLIAMRISRPAINPIKLGLDASRYMWHTRPALVWFLKPGGGLVKVGRLARPWPFGYRAYACQSSVLLINTVLQRLGLGLLNWA